MVNHQDDLSLIKEDIHKSMKILLQLIIPFYKTCLISTFWSKTCDLGWYRYACAPKHMHDWIHMHKLYLFMMLFYVFMSMFSMLTCWCLKPDAMRFFAIYMSISLYACVITCLLYFSYLSHMKRTLPSRRR